MEAASGKDLKWFFDQWVHKAGHPELKVRWHYEDADKTVRVKVEQTQTVDDQTPLFRLPTTLEITEDVGKTRVVPIVIDAALHEFVIPAATKPRMVQIDPEGWLIKELDFEKSARRAPLPARACRLRSRPAGRRAGARQDGQRQARSDQGAVRGLETGKSRPLPGARSSCFWVPATSRPGPPCSKPPGTPRPRSASPRSRAWPSSSTTTRPKPSSALPGPIPRKPTAHARPPCEGSSPGRSRIADQLLDEALKIPADRHSIAATALELMLETPGPKARELAALYSRYGQPRALRSGGRRRIRPPGQGRHVLQDILITLVGDPDRSVRFRDLGRRARAEIEEGSPGPHRATRSGGDRIQRIRRAHARGDARGLERRRAKDRPPPVPRPRRRRSKT